MNLNKSFFRGAFLSFFGLLLFVELFLRGTLSSGLWYAHFDPSGEMTSLAELKDRLEKGDPKSPPFLLLGDSVLGASALTEHRIPQPRTKTLGTFLHRDLATQGTEALNLGSDGLLIPDILGITPSFDSRPPRGILLLLNFRMFSKEFNEGPKALSRSFLLGELPAPLRSRFAPEVPPSLETSLGDWLYGGFCRHWVLFREAQALRNLWYYPSRTDFFQRILEKIMGMNESQSDIAEAALIRKIRPYYQAGPWEKGGLPFTCLRSALEEWSKRKIPVTVVLTPQNAGFIGKDLDQPSFEKNRKMLADLFRTQGPSGVRYEDWSRKYPGNDFLDHCHMTPEGNERYAQDLVGLIGGGK